MANVIIWLIDQFFQDFQSTFYSQPIQIVNLVNVIIRLMLSLGPKRISFSSYLLFLINLSNKSSDQNDQSKSK
jgi:hypothetical protein